MDNSQIAAKDQEVTQEKQDKQVVSLGKGFILTVILFAVLLALGIFLWQESFNGNQAPVTSSSVPTNIPKLKIKLNSNFN